MARNVAPGEDVLSNLGRKIRAAREGRGILLKDLAAHCGVTASLLSQVERGLAHPSLNTLHRISESLDVPLYTFFTSPPSDEDAVVRANERRRLLLPGCAAVYEMLSPAVSRHLEVGLIRLDPGQHSVDKPTSHKADEIALILEGEISCEMEGRTVTLETGDTILVEEGTRHRWLNSGTRPGRVLFAMSPPTF